MKNSVSVLKKIKAFAASHCLHLREMCSPSKIKDAREIPIIILVFNRLTMPKMLIESLAKRGYSNIHIIDNNSTYPPLLEYYKTCPYEIIRLKENVGYRAIWKVKELKKRFCSDYYIYTDPDLVLDDNCPDDVIDYLFRLLRDKYKYSPKIGLSLRIDDIPDYFDNKKEVMEWEGKYYEQINEDGLFRAPVDTTLALYRPYAGLNRSRAAKVFRTPPPYSMRHLPWYVDSTKLSDEDKYYIDNCRSKTHWSEITQVESLDPR